MVMKHMDVEPTKFNFEGNNIRTLLIEGQPYFVGKDIADTLGYSNSSKAVNIHVDVEDKIKRQIPTSQNGHLVSMTNLINESGLYSLILSSKLPSAKQFKHWVTNDVLPEIRKTGKYEREPQPNLGEFADKIPSTYSDALMLAGQAMKQHEKDKPKLEYYDKAMNNPALITTSEIAMSYGMSAVALNKVLHKCHVIYKRGRTWIFYQEYKNKGYGDLNTFNGSKNGKSIASNTLKWTQRGARMIDKLLADHGIYRSLTLDMDVTKDLPGKLD